MDDESEQFKRHLTEGVLPPLSDRLSAEAPQLVSAILQGDRQNLLDKGTHPM
jgi:hypothetical protein